MKWDVFGAPFSLKHSSCSNMKPKMFSWEDVDLDVEIWMDSALEQGLVTPKRRRKKYAWICESRSVVPFLSNLYAKDEDGWMFVDGITPTLQSMINEYDAIFTCDEDLVALHDKIHFCYAGSTLPWIPKHNYGMHYKTSKYSMIASNKVMCRGHEERKKVVTAIQKFGPVSEDNKNPATILFGGVTGEPFGQSENLDENWHDKSGALTTFLYSVVMENDRYPSYFTEKLTDCFVTGTVPIYWGSPNIGDHFDINGIIMIEGPGDVPKILKNLDNSHHYKVDYLKRQAALRKNYQLATFLESPDDMLYRKIVNMENE